MKIPRTVTPAKDAANKNNAKTSTDPTSDRGKDVAKRYAFRHGILTTDMSLPGESATEPEERLDEMKGDHRPAGTDEAGDLDNATARCQMTARTNAEGPAAEHPSSATTGSGSPKPAQQDGGEGKTQM